MKINVLIGTLSLMSSLVFGQSPSLHVIAPSDYLPQTPTAAALGKYVDQPVNLYTGVPEISIPIYTIDLGDYTLPLSLSYHAGGIKVSEGASWVGLGWSLSTGANINRTIQSIEDLPSGNANSYISFKNRAGGILLDPNDPEDYVDLNLIKNGTIDSAPDLFHYSIPGHSGKFILLEQKLLIPSEPVAITATCTSYPAKPQSFVITDTKGVKYSFWDTETAKKLGSGGGAAKVTSYLISKITTPLNRDIFFNYGKSSQYLQDIAGLFQQKYSVNSPGSSVPLEARTFSGSQSINYGKVLTNITWAGGYAIFFSSEREDVMKETPTSTGDFKLDKIEIYNTQGELIKRILFSYTYFTSGSSTAIGKRLKLESVTFEDASGVPGAVYSFLYDGTNLPDRYSVQTDHWGFYNGKGMELPTFNGGVLDLSSKESDLEKTKANTLTAIVYPTKGKTEFTYELNDYYDPTYTVQTQTFSCLADPFAGKPFEDIAYFSISGPLESISFNTSVINNSWPTGSQYAGVQIEGPEVINGYVQANNGDHFYTAGFEAGEYTVTCKVIHNKSAAGLSNGVVKSRMYNYFKQAGGLRIKSIKQISGNANPDIETAYEYRNGYASSGMLLNSKPTYLKPFTHYISNFAIGDLSYCTSWRTENHAWLYSGIQGTTFSNALVGYGAVTVLNGLNGENGKTIHTFENGSAGTNDYTWMYGQPLTTHHYDAQDKLVQSVVNEYETINDVAPAITSLSVELLSSHYCSNDFPYVSSSPRVFSQSITTHIQGWRRLKKTIKTQVDQSSPTSLLTTTSSYSHDNYHQMIKVVEDFGLNKKKVINQFVYPQGKNANGVYGDMVVKNRVSELVEMTVINQSDESASSQRIIDKKTLKFEPTVIGAQTFELLRSSYKLKTSSPLPVLTSIPENSSADPGLELINTIEYPTSGTMVNPISVTENITGIKSSFIWSGDNKVMASVTQATSDGIAYTSFESSVPGGQPDLGGWTINTFNLSTEFRTGVKSAQNITLSKTLLPLGNYDVSLFVKGSGNVTINGQAFAGDTNWKLIKLTLSGVTSVTIVTPANVSIDEVRLNPVGSMMSTYTYRQGVGITSMTDANMVSSYYIYDLTGRLSVIKDDKGNILKTMEYHLKQ